MYSLCQFILRLSFTLVLSIYLFGLFYFSVAGEPPHFQMHVSIEENFRVLLAFPLENDGRRVLKLVGKRDNFRPVLDFCGRIADNEILTAPTTPMKVERHNVARKKLFFCPYCSTAYANRVVEHCQKLHPTEDLVMKISALPTTSTERKELIRVSYISSNLLWHDIYWLQIILWHDIYWLFFFTLQRLNNKGNFLYNCRVLQGEIPNGKVIPVRRNTEGRPNSAYLPCPGCEGFYVKKELWRHCRTCSAVAQEGDNEEIRDFKVCVTANAKLLLSSATTSSAQLQEFVSIFSNCLSYTLYTFIYLYLPNIFMTLYILS